MSLLSVSKPFWMLTSSNQTLGRSYRTLTFALEMWYVTRNGFTWTYLVTLSQVLEIKDGEFTWSKDAQSPTLEGVNLVVRKGELTGIVGRVGAGKVCFYHDVRARLTPTTAVEPPFFDHRRHAPY